MTSGPRSKPPFKLLNNILVKRRTNKSRGWFWKHVALMRRYTWQSRVNIKMLQLKTNPISSILQPRPHPNEMSR